MNVWTNEIWSAAELEFAAALDIFIQSQIFYTALYYLPISNLPVRRSNQHGVAPELHEIGTAVWPAKLQASTLHIRSMV